ncbi:hypothetical protein DRO91_09720 [Candidatus Heimdallarchaeota archaeon]|nr:MAG: hypothetical protein DRO63_07030 [Candidatus Gerdarchaeota archaeon]RLI67602.1 MAG: hypothetical protein DRP02_14205 [Candidatus Gerdarchaeota archaeon]RLI67870.1 MAG: hypothetical protein DRO91_09720 [Candidatus Heimdallarchaeota archaeon]
MGSDTKRITKLYSQSAILTIGTILVAVLLFFFKVIFYQKSQPFLYSEFLLAYSFYLFYSLFGYLNVGNPLSNDAYKTRVIKENGIAEYLFNAIYLVIIFSFLSSLTFAINLAVLKINGFVILQFCLAMLFSNINLVLIAFFRGIEKIVTSSSLLAMKGAFKTAILYLFSFLLLMNAVKITLAFLLGELISAIISILILVFWIKRNSIVIPPLFKPNFPIIKRYFLQCIPLVLISFSFQGYNSFIYTIVEHHVSKVALGYLDVAVTFLTFFIAFFNNIGLMLAANSDRFNKTKGFFKFLFLQIFSMSIAITVLYEIIAYFIDFDDNILQEVFNLDGGTLARSVMIILPALSFYVLFNVVSGYKQGKRQYYSISLASILAILLSFLPGYLLIIHLGLDGALFSFILFSFLLAVLVISMTARDSFEMRMAKFFKNMRKRRREKVLFKNNNFGVNGE